MKKYLPVFIFLAIIITCCKKDDDIFYWGEVSLKWNGDYWMEESKIRAFENLPHHQGINIEMERFNSNGFEREDIFIYKIPLTIGRFDISETKAYEIDDLTGASYTTLLDDGDVIGDFYKLLEDGHDNFVEIEKIKGDEIWGTFEVAFVKDLIGSVEGDPMAPDTVIITEGMFHTKILD
jgi:hypothetical protein